MKTGEKGFTFLANGKTEAKAEEVKADVEAKAEKAKAKAKKEETEAGGDEA